MLFSIYKFSASATTQNALRLIGERLRNYRPFRDTLDILLVAAILFAVWFFTRKSRVAHFIGLFVICWVLLTFISSLLDLSVFSYILRYLMQSALLGTIVILMMRLLDHLGRVGDFSVIAWFKQLFTKKREDDNESEPIDAICQAAVDLSRNRTGGLIVIERHNCLDDLIKTGVDIDAMVSPYLIRNIFYEGAPLHDGALIIRRGRIYAAGCILPITHRLDVNPDLGTRHRAAIGMSESTDAVVIVISEESGIISIAYMGELVREYDYNSLKQELKRLLTEKNGKMAEEPSYDKETEDDAQN